MTWEMIIGNNAGPPWVHFDEMLQGGRFNSTVNGSVDFGQEAEGPVSHPIIRGTVSACAGMGTTSTVFAQWRR